jgi:hypothetical protein
MLKKSAVSVILLLMLISFTIGSVSTASEPAYKTGRAMIDWRNVPMELRPQYFNELSFPPPGDLKDDHINMDVILDFYGQPPNDMMNVTWGKGELMPRPPGFLVRHDVQGNYDYIEGRMVVKTGGNDTFEAFPVKYMKHSPGTGAPRPFMDSYRANMAVRLNGSESPSFTFNSEIFVLNQSLSNDLSGLQGSLYDDRITAGQTVYHQAQVSGGTTALNFDLKWNDTATGMRLVVYTPDGHVLGPYYDSSDGKTDGRINMVINNSAGVAGGTWSFKVTDTGVTGKDEYYLKTW